MRLKEPNQRQKHDQNTGVTGTALSTAGGHRGRGVLAYSRRWTRWWWGAWARPRRWWWCREAPRTSSRTAPSPPPTPPFQTGSARQEIEGRWGGAWDGNTMSLSTSANTPPCSYHQSVVKRTGLSTPDGSLRLNKTNNLTMPCIFCFNISPSGNIKYSWTVVKAVIRINQWLNNC